MEEGSEGGLWNSIRNFFSGKSENPIEDVIIDAHKNEELANDVAKMLLNVLRLGRNQVREIMIPRTDIDCVEVNAPIREVVEVIIKSGHSRIPIYQDNKDHIVGIIHAKDLLKLFFEPQKQDQSIEEMMRLPLFIPETKNVQSMLLEFQSKKVHLAIAIDEYGGTSGLITFEDVLEEIVGEIEDEYDTPKPSEIQFLEDESCLVSGRTSLEDLREQLGIEINSEFVETIGGYLTEQAGRVPQEGESFYVNGYTFRIKEADNKQVLWISLYPIPASMKKDETE